MGAKALAGFVNEYSNADESSKKIAEELIKNETQVVEKVARLFIKRNILTLASTAVLQRRTADSGFKHSAEIA